MSDAAQSVLPTGRRGLTAQEAALRLVQVGPNVVHQRRSNAARVLIRQFRSPILLLLIATAAVSFVVGDSTNSLIIAVILLASIGLGFANEYRAERAADALYDSLRHHVTVVRDGRPGEVDVSELVPGDVVRLTVGTVVPADMRVLEEQDLSCDEAILTGEPESARKSEPVDGADAASSTLQMGTIVHTGTALIDSLLFSLAIAVGITPQLLPAVVSTSLAAGTRALARRKVLVKRLVCIEDLGDLDVLVTDKTGTLTQGRIEFGRSLPVDGDMEPEQLIGLALAASEVDYRNPELDVTGLNSFDAALWEHSGADAYRTARIAPPLDVLPFDHERRMTSALVQQAGGCRHRMPRAWRARPNTICGLPVFSCSSIWSRPMRRPRWVVWPGSGWR